MFLPVQQVVKTNIKNLLAQYAILFETDPFYLWIDDQG